MLSHAPLPSAHALRQELPLSSRQSAFVRRSREALERILDGIDQRLVLILGPCSIHHIPAAKDYALRLKQLADELEDRFLILFRAHFEKPRTRTGWKGLLYDPHLDGSDNLDVGLRRSRQFLIDMANMEIPVSTEFLDPNLAYYVSDLISWGQIGARTSESQIHRQMASNLSMPIGFKNRPDGDVSVAVNAVVAAHQPQSFFGWNLHHELCRLQSAGNPYCNVVLRGGASGPNYDLCSVADTAERLLQHGQSPRVLIDCAHDNSRKSPSRQLEVFRHVMEESLKDPQHITGIMLESYLEKGNQTHHPDPRLLDPYISITDPCINWESTEALIREAAQLKAARSFAIV